MSDKECIETDEIVNDQLFMQPLNAEEEHLVNDCYDLNNKDKELSKVGRISTAGRDLKTLEYPQQSQNYKVDTGEGEINDNIMLAYLHLLRESITEVGLKMLIYDTNFYAKLSSLLAPYENDAGSKTITVEPMTQICAKYHRDVDLTNVDFAVFPINVGRHWMVVVLDTINKSVIHYDPMTHTTSDQMTRQLKIVKAYLKFVSITRQYLNFFESFIYMQSKRHPTQEDFCSCGVFCLLYVRCIVHLLPLKFSKDDITLGRKRIAVDIMKGYTNALEMSTFNIIVQPPMRKNWFLNGDACVIRCVAGEKFAGKQNLSYTWYRDNGNPVMVNRGSELRLDMELGEDLLSGTYHCIVKCSERKQEIRSDWCILTVKPQPSCTF